MVNGHRHDDVTTALSLVLRHLAASGYRFTTPTTLTHRRVLAHRSGQIAGDLRDVFGWNLPFRIATCNGMTRELVAAMRGAGVVYTCPNAQHARGEVLQSRVRVANVGDDLFVHSAYPAAHDNAVFFGPDTYRFARFIKLTAATHLSAMDLPTNLPLRILDVGCGSGAGGIVAARALAHLGRVEVSMNDINPVALQYTAANVAHANLAGISVRPALGNALRAVQGDFDLIISNSPYVPAKAQRLGNEAGERVGQALSVRIGKEALTRLAPGGRLMLYTGVAMVNGVDSFLADMQPHLADTQFDWAYSEIDPDVFGEELEQPLYAHVDRIAAVGLTVTRRTGLH